MKTSEKIIKARQEENLTQDQLAERLGVSRQTVSKWELDISLPESARLNDLSKALKVSVDYLLDDKLDSDTPTIPMKKKSGSIQPDWSKLYPVIAEYKEVVEVEKYATQMESIFQDLMNTYSYSREDAMLVAKEILASTYFKK